MSDLIRRSDLKKHCVSCSSEWCSKESKHCKTCPSAIVTREMIDNAPTIVVGYLTNCQNCVSDYSRGYDDGYKEGYKAERPQGKWEYKTITDDYRVYGRCSNCLQRKRIDNYCPNCGAKMEVNDDRQIE